MQQLYPLGNETILSAATLTATEAAAAVFA
jgi:hypothetical protein